MHEVTLTDKEIESILDGDAVTVEAADSDNVDERKLYCVGRRNFQMPGANSGEEGWEKLLRGERDNITWNQFDLRVTREDGVEHHVERALDAIDDATDASDSEHLDGELAAAIKVLEPIVRDTHMEEWGEFVGHSATPHVPSVEMAAKYIEEYNAVKYVDPDPVFHDIAVSPCNRDTQMNLDLPYGYEVAGRGEIFIWVNAVDPGE